MYKYIYYLIIFIDQILKQNLDHVRLLFLSLKVFFLPADLVYYCNVAAVRLVILKLLLK